MSRASGTAYSLGHAADRCAATGAPLAPGDPIVAALIEPEDDGPLTRLDFCRAAWDQGHRPRRLFAWWRASVPEPSRTNRLTFDAPTLLALVEQLEEAQEPRRIAFRYALALILMRKRHLVSAGRRDAGPDGPAALLLRPRTAPPEDAPWVIVDPEMDEQAVADVTAQLREALGLDS